MFKDFLGKAFPVIEKFAPTVAGALISPAVGSETALALALLSEAFNIKPSDNILSHEECESALKLLEKKFLESK